MAKDYTIKAEWFKINTGQLYVVKAISKTNSNLAVVKVEIPLAAGADFETAFGSATKESVETAAQQEAKRIADARPE
jgi:translation elongation factor EF-G